MDVTTWDDKPNDYEAALAEIERLRALEQSYESLSWGLEQFKNNQDAIIAAVRDATIEECARVVEGIRARTVDYAIAQAAAAIRALKEKA